MQFRLGCKCRTVESEKRSTSVGKCGRMPLSSSREFAQPAFELDADHADIRGVIPLRSRTGMTYCLGIKTRAGLVMASDSRTNAGLDQVNVCRKMHTFVQPGARAFILLSSGGLSICQSVVSLLRDSF